MDQQQSSLSSQEWPSLSPSPNVESEKLVKNKKCDECPFVTHKTYNLKNHKKSCESNSTFHGNPEMSRVC